MILSAKCLRMKASWLSLPPLPYTQSMTSPLGSLPFQPNLNHVLEPKCHDRNYAFPTLVNVNAHSNKLKNIHKSKVNDMFTPKPAKLHLVLHTSICIMAHGRSCARTRAWHSFVLLRAALDRDGLRVLRHPRAGRRADALG